MRLLNGSRRPVAGAALFGSAVAVCFGLGFFVAVPRLARSAPGPDRGPGPAIATDTVVPDTGMVPYRRIVRSDSGGDDSSSDMGSSKWGGRKISYG